MQHSSRALIINQGCARLSPCSCLHSWPLILLHNTYRNTLLRFCTPCCFALQEVQNLQQEHQRSKLGRSTSSTPAGSPWSASDPAATAAGGEGAARAAAHVRRRALDFSKAEQMHRDLAVLPNLRSRGGKPGASSSSGGLSGLPYGAAAFGEAAAAEQHLGSSSRDLDQRQQQDQKQSRFQPDLPLLPLDLSECERHNPSSTTGLTPKEPFTRSPRTKLDDAAAVVAGGAMHALRRLHSSSSEEQQRRALDPVLRSLARLPGGYSASSANASKLRAAATAAAAAVSPGSGGKLPVMVPLDNLSAVAAAGAGHDIATQVLQLLQGDPGLQEQELGLQDVKNLFDDHPSDEEYQLEQQQADGGADAAAAHADEEADEEQQPAGGGSTGKAAAGKGWSGSAGKQQRTSSRRPAAAAAAAAQPQPSRRSRRIARSTPDAAEQRERTTSPPLRSSSGNRSRKTARRTADAASEQQEEQQQFKQDGAAAAAMDVDDEQQQQQLDLAAAAAAAIEAATAAAGADEEADEAAEEVTARTRSRSGSGRQSSGKKSSRSQQQQQSASSQQGSDATAGGAECDPEATAAAAAAGMAAAAGLDASALAQQAAMFPGLQTLAHLQMLQNFGVTPDKARSRLPGVCMCVRGHVRVCGHVRACPRVRVWVWAGVPACLFGVLRLRCWPVGWFNQLQQLLCGHTHCFASRQDSAPSSRY